MGLECPGEVYLVREMGRTEAMPWLDAWGQRGRAQQQSEGSEAGRAPDPPLQGRRAVGISQHPFPLGALGNPPEHMAGGRSQAGLLLTQLSQSPGPPVLGGHPLPVPGSLPVSGIS